MWSWNPFEWTSQEWDTVGAVAGTVALAAAVVGGRDGRYCGPCHRSNWMDGNGHEHSDFKSRCLQ